MRGHSVAERERERYEDVVSQWDAAQAALLALIEEAESREEDRECPTS